jgi:hypothetical protein
MKRLYLAVLACVLGAGMVALAQRDGVAVGATNSPAMQKVRVGVYDSRAVAVAYAPSRFNPVREKMAEHQAAKSAGDQQKVKELETWGEQHQRMLHFQGFCRVPVSDLLEPVRDGLGQIIIDQKLTAIVMACDAVASDVEIVDVTDAIVELYEPSDKTRQTVSEIRNTEPVSILTIGGGSRGKK